MHKICVGVLLLSQLAFAGGPATGAPGVAFPWATSEKQGFGTAYEKYDRTPRSRVWFTIARGIVTEVFYPRIDIAQTRDTQFVITDGKSFLHQEQYDTQHSVERIAGSAMYKVINRDRWNRYAITKEIWADPESDTLIQKIKIERFANGLKFHLLHKPAAVGTLFGDNAEADSMMAWETNHGLSHWQGLSSTVPFAKKSVGYVGKSDGFTDLNDFKLDSDASEAKNGNVALTATLDMPESKGTTELVLFLSFSENRKDLEHAMGRALTIDVTKSQRDFIDGWKEYLGGLRFPKSGPSRASMLEASTVVLKAAEDKSYPGSVIASPSYPWGEQNFEHGTVEPLSNAGYHAVWPRDLYHIAMGFLSVGDTKTFAAIVRRLQKVQLTAAAGEWHFGPRRRSKAGSFPQNFWVDGRAVYGGYQADETAMPLLLAHRAWREGLLGAEEIWSLVKNGSQFLLDMGPWTQNERWEENYGISPNSAAYVIASLVTSSEIARANGESLLADKLLQTADRWALAPGDNIDAWTYTTDGKITAPLGNSRYYQRLDGAACNKSTGGSAIWDAWWNPLDDGTFCLANFSGAERYRYESEIVDAGFLALVRLGVRAASHHPVRESLPEIDALLRRETPGGPGWYRYRFDGYGEEKKGRLWPLLTGERIHYDLQFLKESLETKPSLILESKLRGFESFANDQGLFSEQVWDEGPLAGRPTGSAMPLLWTHAEYLQTVRSIQDGKIFDEVPSVRERYGLSSAHD